VIAAPNVRGGMHGGDAGASPYVFFAVDDIEAAVERVRDLGGEVEEMAVEGDEASVATFGRFKLCRDDQGSAYGCGVPHENEVIPAPPPPPLACATLVKLIDVSLLKLNWRVVSVEADAAPGSAAAAIAATVAMIATRRGLALRDMVILSVECIVRLHGSTGAAACHQGRPLICAG
jgi:hypothetical protein